MGFSVLYIVEYMKRPRVRFNLPRKRSGTGLYWEGWGGVFAISKER